MKKLFFYSTIIVQFALTTPAYMQNNQTNGSSSGSDDLPPTIIPIPMPNMPAFPTLDFSSGTKSITPLYDASGNKTPTAYQIVLNNPSNVTITVDAKNSSSSNGYQIQKVVMTDPEGLQTTWDYNLSKETGEYHLAGVNEQISFNGVDATYTWLHHSGSPNDSSEQFTFSNTKAGAVITAVNEIDEKDEAILIAVDGKLVPASISIPAIKFKLPDNVSPPNSVPISSSEQKFQSLTVPSNIINPKLTDLSAEKSKEELNKQPIEKTIAPEALKFTK